MARPTVPTPLSINKPELRLALRMTVSSVAAFAIATALGFQQGYWSALTALIVTQTSVGGSLKVAVDRLLASLCGAIYGAGCLFSSASIFVVNRSCTSGGIMTASGSRKWWNEKRVTTIENEASANGKVVTSPCFQLVFVSCLSAASLRD